MTHTDRLAGLNAMSATTRRVRAEPGNERRSRTRLPLAFGVAALLWSGSAFAAADCNGTFVATSLKPLPTPTVVGLDIHDRSPAHLKLSAQFQAGLREAGVAVGERPNVLLHVSSSELSDS